MGQPNWKRLAELGQLPDYAKEERPALAGVSEEVENEKKEVLPDESSLIQEVIIDESLAGEENIVSPVEGEVVLDEDNHGEFVDELLK